jgi:hypothetical protein
VVAVPVLVWFTIPGVGVAETLVAVLSPPTSRVDSSWSGVGLVIISVGVEVEALMGIEKKSPGIMETTWLSQPGWKM